MKIIQFNFFFFNVGINRIKGSDELDETTDSKIVYDEAEKQYTKLSRRYIFSWVGIVTFYAIVLLLVPVNDMLHGQMDASNWTTLFKTSYEKEKPWDWCNENSVKVK